MKKQYLETGKIVGTHGVKGMVRIQQWSDSGEFLTQFGRFYLDAAGEMVLEAERVQPHGTVTLAKFRGVDSIESAEALRGKVLYIDRADVQLPEDRYFVSDLLGCTVYAADETTVLGVLSDVSETGANDVWHVKNGEREYLVPAVDEMIVSVSVEDGRIVLDPIKGIFDDAN